MGNPLASLLFLFYLFVLVYIYCIPEPHVPCLVTNQLSDHVLHNFMPLSAAQPTRRHEIHHRPRTTHGGALGSPAAHCPGFNALVLSSTSASLSLPCTSGGFGSRAEVPQGAVAFHAIQEHPESRRVGGRFGEKNTIV